MILIESVSPNVQNKQVLKIVQKYKNDYHPTKPNEETNCPEKIMSRSLTKEKKTEKCWRFKIT